MTKIAFGLVIAYAAYSGLQEADVVQNIEFKGEVFELTDKSRRAGSTIYTYSPGGRKPIGAEHYIQIVETPDEIKMSLQQFRLEVEQRFKTFSRFQRLSDTSFFYVESDAKVHSVLLADEQSFRFYSYVQVKPKDAMSNRGRANGNHELAEDLEKTIANLPSPPSVIATWF